MSLDSSDIQTMAHTSGSADLPMSGFPKGRGVIAECEITAEGGDSIEKLYGECKKHPGHTSFIPVPDFKMADLPEEYQTEKMMKKMKDLCDLTVKILIKYISLERPDKYADSDEKYPYSGKMRGSKRIRRYGTGFVRSFGSSGSKSHVQGERCPCPLCKDSDPPQMEYWTLLVGTATHVIFDDSEAACAVIECFYDTQGRAEVKTMYGLSLMKRGLEFNKHQSDACYLNCVTHDKDLFDKLHKLCCNYNATFMETFESPLAYVIAHPHGCSKRITFGKLLHFTVPIDMEYPVETPVMFVEGTQCKIPQLPWWKILVAKDDKSDLHQSSTSNQSGPVDSNTMTKQTVRGKDPDKKVLKHVKVNDSSSSLSDRIVIDANTEGHPDTLNGSHQKASDVKAKKNPSEEFKHASNSTKHVSQNETKAAISDNDENDKVSSFRRPSTVIDDYSHRGATSLCFQELNIASENSRMTGMNPQSSNEETHNEEPWCTDQPRDTLEGVKEGGCLSSAFEEKIEEVIGAAFLPRTGFSYRSWFVDNMPDLPPGTSLALPPEVEYLLNAPDYDSGFSLEPGKQCGLPFGTIFTLPSTAKFSMRFAGLNPPWYTLPPGTNITLPDGKTFLLPPETEFLTENMKVRFIYVTFDMATCPGSSGAIIHQEGVGMLLPFSAHNFSHFGAMADGFNRSGLQNLCLVV